jgi:hypothetical protein
MHEMKAIKDRIQESRDLKHPWRKAGSENIELQGKQWRK